MPSVMYVAAKALQRDLQKSQKRVKRLRALVSLMTKWHQGLASPSLQASIFDKLAEARRNGDII